MSINLTILFQVFLFLLLLLLLFCWFVWQYLLLFNIYIHLLSWILGYLVRFMFWKCEQCGKVCVLLSSGLCVCLCLSVYHLCVSECVLARFFESNAWSIDLIFKRKWMTSKHTANAQTENTHTQKIDLVKISWFPSISKCLWIFLLGGVIYQ